jgi:hypothetical protein
VTACPSLVVLWSSSDFAPLDDALRGLRVTDARGAAYLTIAIARVSHRDHAPDGLLLGRVGHQATIDNGKAERPLATVIDALRCEVTLHVSDTLANAVALALSYRGENCKCQLSDAVARDVTAQVDQVQRDAFSF